MGEMVSELKNYARETRHEKIIRGISVGLALMQFQKEENADALIEDMRTDRDPVLRYGAQYALALAYCGTGSNKAIRILLHTAVSDVSDKWFYSDDFCRWDGSLVAALALVSNDAHFWTCPNSYIFYWFKQRLQVSQEFCNCLQLKT